MPVLRSREIVYHGNSRAPSKGKKEQSQPLSPTARSASPPPTPPPLFTPPPSVSMSPISPVCTSESAFSSQDTSLSSRLGLGLASGRRRSLRLATVSVNGEGPGGSQDSVIQADMKENQGEEGRGKRTRVGGAECDPMEVEVAADALVSVGASDETQDGEGEKLIRAGFSPTGNIEIAVQGSGSSGRSRSGRFTAAEKVSVGASDETPDGEGGEEIPAGFSLAGSIQIADGVRGGGSSGRRRSRRFTAAEKGKTKVLAEEATVPMGGLDGKNTLEAASMDAEEDPEGMPLDNEKPDMELNLEDIPATFLEEDRIARQALEWNHRSDHMHVNQNAPQNNVQPGNEDVANGGEYWRRRKAFKDGALKAAPKYAYYRDAGAQEDVDSENSDAGDPESEDWPGPFSTAMKLINEREAKLKARLAEAGSSSASEHMDLKWKPATKQEVVRVAPTLAEMTMRVLSENAAHIVSLEGLPSPLLKQFCLQASATGNMGYHVLGLLADACPMELHLANCTFATEEKFEEIFSRCSVTQLEVLQLDISGRCLPDYVLRSTFVRGPNSLPNLHSVSLRGNYRLSDDGLEALASAAPMLHSVDLSQCSLITSSGVNIFLEKLEAVITELILDDCANVSGLKILPALKKMQNLENVSVSGLVDVNNRFVTELVSHCGQNLKGLGIAGCGKLSTNTMKIISEKCHQLCVVDLRNINKLDDGVIMHLASCCLPLQTLKLQRGNCSDNAVAALLESSGKSLVELSLNNFEKVAHNTALAISSACFSTLRELDLSFCRVMSDEALGVIADSCTNLKILKLFGCTQVTDVFLKGHSNRHLNVIGLNGSILK